jgi:putative colanic acid biosynthesis UDP-glucose lipid carrier transferase
MQEEMTHCQATLFLVYTIWIKKLSTSLQHTATQHIPAHNWPVKPQNGIIRSFVATRKKYLFFKRVFDLAFSVIVILGVMSWLLPLAALAIKLNSRGPVFFRQKRIGKTGKVYSCIKFRTMIRNDEADERPAEENDERITRVGKFLRLTNLDELPQFFNVLMGQMSVVGPRPHMLADCIRFSFVIRSYQFRSLTRPGITGWAQINGFHGPTLDYESIIIRYYWDAQYVRKANFWLDLKIIGATILQTIRNIRMVFMLHRDKKNTATTR